MDIFSVSKSDVPQLIKFLKEYPKDIRFGTASVLTALAFKTRDLNIKEINTQLTVRNEGFVKRMLKVEKAKPSHNMMSQMAIAGSLKSKNFSGWIEQETGKTSKKKTAATLAARGGNRGSTIKGKYRFKKENKFYKPSEFTGRDLRSKFQHMMRILNKKNEEALFILNEEVPTKRGHLKKGLYALKNRRIQKIQKISGLREPRRVPWMTNSVKQLNQSNTSEAWRIFFTKHEQIIKSRAPH